MAEQGGMVFDAGDGLRFLPIAIAVTLGSRIVPVPGLVAPAMGLTLADDLVVTVLRAGTVVSSDLVLCDIDGVMAAISGVRVLATGRFPVSPEQDRDVIWEDRVAKHLDVRALYFEAEQAVWSARALRQDARQA
jgi:hypothetical protein